MASGDVKRGAGVEVALVARSREFDRAWGTLMSEFQSAHGHVRSAYDEVAAELKQSAVAPSSEVRRLTEASERLIAASRGVREIADTYRRRAVDLVRSHASKAAQADVDGHYRIRGVAPGAYRVFAHYQVFENDLYWLVPIETKSGGNTLDLSNGNAGWPIK